MAVHCGKIDKDGFITIPPDLLLELGISDGEDVLVELKDVGLCIRAVRKMGNPATNEVSSSQE